MQTPAQRLQATFDAGRAANLPVTLHMNKVTLTSAKGVEITFDPLYTANFADLIKDRLGFTIKNDCVSRSFVSDGTVTVAYKGAELVHGFTNQAPWKAECEAIVRMGALLWSAQQAILSKGQ